MSEQNLKMKPREISFRVMGREFAAQEWGEPGQLPVLALHGWLDNSASFNTLAPLLSKVHLVALDMAGHGQSEHRDPYGPYNIWEDVAEVFAVADQLGWSRFAILGHSRGAIAGMLAAGTFPERISHLALIDGIWPEPVEPDQAPEQLARSIKHMSVQRSKTVYATVEEAIQARVKGLFPLDYEAAKVLTDRGLKHVPGGYHWSSDQGLLAPSALKFTQAHIKAFIQRITAPTSLVLAEEGVMQHYEGYREGLARFPHIHVEFLPGGHHLHMHAEAPQVAEICNALLSQQ